jgi:hypothetical protein
MAAAELDEGACIFSATATPLTLPPLLLSGDLTESFPPAGVMRAVIGAMVSLASRFIESVSLGSVQRVGGSGRLCE